MLMQIITHIITCITKIVVKDQIIFEYPNHIKTISTNQWQIEI